MYLPKRYLPKGTSLRRVGEEDDDDDDDGDDDYQSFQAPLRISRFTFQT
jgi:hypothetical protein